MKLETIALVLVLVLGTIWAGVMLTGLVATLPYGLPILLIVAVVAYLLVRVVLERVASKEDDYYEKNVKR